MTPYILFYKESNEWL